MVLSLIIPVYNVEKYISNCIQSCLKQNISQNDYEIIFIDDGTPDGSMNIVNSYYKEYPNLIKTHIQKNKGLSAARNAGIKLAKGDYIWFIDSDDWITPNCLKQVKEKLISESPDILALCAANIINNQIIRRNSYKDETPQTGKKAFNQMISPCAPFAIYKRKFLLEKNLFFYEGIYHEDSEFMPRVYYYANIVSFLNTICYNVFQNPTSITRTINPKKAFDIITVCKSLNTFSKKVTTDCIAHLDYLISMNLNNALSNSYTMDSINIKRLNEHIYNNRFLLNHLKRTKTLKYKIEYILFHTFPHHTIQIYKTIQYFNLKKLKIKKNNFKG